jgi:hypothetical protein
MDNPYEKGHQVRLIGGKYKGMTAWANPHKEPTKFCIHVIILLDDSTEYKTFLNRKSVGKPLSPPESYEDAALQQHPKVMKLMEDLAKQLAMCGIRAESQNIHNIFEKKIVKYAKIQNDDNENVLWKKVDWDEDDEYEDVYEDDEYEDVEDNEL